MYVFRGLRVKRVALKSEEFYKGLLTISQNSQ